MCRRDFPAQQLRQQRVAQGGEGAGSVFKNVDNAQVAGFEDDGGG